MNESSSKQKQTATGLEIAVIGMSGRFPGANDINRFWENLRQGVESVTVFSDEELIEAGVEKDLLENPNYVKSKCVLDNVDQFDASFFEYFPKEARMMDPQMRIFHECVWEALEDAGYVPDNYVGLIGLYAGASTNIYWELLGISAAIGSPADQFGAVNLIDKDFMCTQISYKLNLKGPSVFVKSACSTSLLAIHTASRALLTGECDMALAGGVTVELPHKTGYLYQEGMILSPDGHCRAFDAKANGIVGGEGAGVVVLKLLKNALRDGDHIYAVIKGSAVNNDGNRKVGYSAPSIEGQADVIRAAHRISRVEPSSISYVETHGTGTALGDPVEVEALCKAFPFEGEPYCAIGSLKTNIGHLDSAAGVASFIKTALALKNKEIPASLHFNTSNPEIDFARSPFYVNTALKKWEGSNSHSPLRAGVSAFATGGTNVHIILEEALPQETSSDQEEQRNHLMVLSAKSIASLDRMTERLSQYLQKHPNARLGDVAYTLQVGRKQFQHRRALACSTVQEASSLLINSDAVYTSSSSASPKIIFMFPGQGSQYVEMGLDLYNKEPIFRNEIDKCFHMLHAKWNIDLYPIVFPSVPNEEVQGKINQTEYAQPLLFVFEYALAQLLIQWGVKPHAMIGHSLGEYVAATIAGVLTLEDALELVQYRGKLMQSVLPGAMMSVALSKHELQPFLDDSISIAAVNTPTDCVVSGQILGISLLQERLQQAGHRTRMLHTSHAFHSEMMDGILLEYENRVKAIKLYAPRIAYISNVTGEWISAEQATGPAYWAEHLRCAVHFSAGMDTLMQVKGTVFVEVGPGNTLSAFCNKQLREQQPTVVQLIRHPNETHSDHKRLLDGIGKLWANGVSIEWKQLHISKQRSRVSLPGYCFERQRYWLEGSPMEMITAQTTGKAEQTQAKHVSLQDRSDGENRKGMSDWFHTPTWKRSVPANNRERCVSAPSLCLVFAGDVSIHYKLVQHLLAEGNEIITVHKAIAFRYKDDGHYELNPNHEDDYRSLIGHLRDRNKFPHKIVQLWNANDGAISGFTEQLEDALSAGFYSLVSLAKSIGEIMPSHEMQLFVISDRMHDVIGEGRLRSDRALLMGPVGVIPLEYPNIRCRSIDIEIPMINSWQEMQLVNLLAAELLSDGDREVVVALRGNVRWIRETEPVYMEELFEKRERLRMDGVYVITGGLGAVGLLLAEHIASIVRSKIVLIGRTTFPSRDQWPQWLTDNGIDHKTSRAIAAIQQIEAAGSEVMVLSAEVSNQEQMEAAIGMVTETFGCINGVIHAAGIADGGMIKQRMRDLSERVFASKVHGTLVLDSIIDTAQLDFIVLCSSLASFIPAIGDVAYSSANAFLDAYANYKSRKDGIFVVSVNWDGIKEVGMTVETAKKIAADLQIADYRILLKHDEDVLTPLEVQQVFVRLLQAAPVPNVLVSTTELSSRLSQAVIHPITVQEGESEVTSNGHSTQEDNHYRQEIGDKIVAIFEDKLGLSNIRIQDNYFDLGIDSLALVQIYSVINDLYPGKLNVHHLFDSKTIQKLIDIIVADREVDGTDLKSVNIIEF